MKTGEKLVSVRRDENCHFQGTSKTSKTRLRLKFLVVLNAKLGRSKL